MVHSLKSFHITVVAVVCCCSLPVVSLPPCSLSCTVSGSTCTFPNCTIATDFSPDIVQAGQDILNGGGVASASTALLVIFEGITVQSLVSDILVNFNTQALSPTYSNPIQLELWQLDASGVVGFSTRVLLNTMSLPVNSSVVLSRVSVTATTQTFSGPFAAANCSMSALCFAPSALQNVSYLQVDKCRLNVTSTAATTIGVKFADAAWNFDRGKVINISSNAIYVASAVALGGAVVGVLFPMNVRLVGKNVSLLVGDHQNRSGTGGIWLLNSRPVALRSAVALLFPGSLDLLQESMIVVSGVDCFVEASTGANTYSAAGVSLLKFQSAALWSNAVLSISNVAFTQSATVGLSISSQLTMIDVGSISVIDGASFVLRKVTFFGSGGVAGPSPVVVGLGSISMNGGLLLLQEVMVVANVSSSTSLTFKAISLSFSGGLVNNSQLLIADCTVIALSLPSVPHSFQMVAIGNESLLLSSASTLLLQSCRLVSDLSTSSTSLVFLNISAVVLTIRDRANFSLSNNTVDSFSQSRSAVVASRNTIFLIARRVEASNGSVFLVACSTLLTRNATVGATVVGFVFDAFVLSNSSVTIRSMQYRFDVTNVPSSVVYFFRSDSLNVTNYSTVGFDDCNASIGAASVESASSSSRAMMALGLITLLPAATDLQSTQRIRISGCTLTTQWTALTTSIRNQSFQLIAASFAGNGGNTAIEIARSDLAVTVALSGSFVTFVGGVDFSFGGDSADVFPNLFVSATRLTVNASNYHAASLLVVGIQVAQRNGATSGVSCGSVVFQSSSVRVRSQQAMTVAFSFFAQVQSTSQNLPSGPTVSGKGVALLDSFFSAVATRIEPTTIFQGDHVYGIVMNVYSGSALGQNAPAGVDNFTAFAIVATVVFVNSSNCPGQLILCQAMGFYSSMIVLSNSFALINSVITVVGHRMVRAFFVNSLVSDGESFASVNNTFSLTLPNNTAPPAFRSSLYIINTLSLQPSVSHFSFDRNTGSLAAQYTSTTTLGTISNYIGGVVYVSSPSFFYFSVSNNSFDISSFTAQTNCNLYGLYFSFRSLPCAVCAVVSRNRVNITASTALHSLYSLQGMWLVVSLGGTNFTLQVEDNMFAATLTNRGATSDAVTALGIYLAQGATFTVPSYTSDLGSFSVARNIFFVAGARFIGYGLMAVLWFVPGLLVVKNNNVSLSSDAPTSEITMSGILLAPVSNYSGASTFATNVIGNSVQITVWQASVLGKFYGITFGGPDSAISLDLSNSTGFVVARNSIMMNVSISLASQVNVTHAGIALLTAIVTVSMPPSVSTRVAKAVDITDNDISFSNSRTMASSAIFIGPSPAVSGINISRCHNCVLNVSGNRIASMRGVNFTGAWEVSAVGSAISFGVILVDSSAAVIITKNTVSSSADTALLSFTPTTVGFMQGGSLVIDGNQAIGCAMFRGFVMTLGRTPLCFRQSGFLVIRNNAAINTSLLAIVMLSSGLVLDRLSSCAIALNCAHRNVGSFVAMFAFGLQVRQVTRSSLLTIQSNAMTLSNATTNGISMVSAIVLTADSGLQLLGQSSVYIVNNTGEVNKGAATNTTVTFIFVNGSIVFTPPLPLRGGAVTSVFALRGNVWSNGSSLIAGPPTSLLRSDVTLMTLMFALGCNSLGPDLSTPLTLAQYMGSLPQVMPPSFASQVLQAPTSCGSCDVTLDCFAPNARGVTLLSRNGLCQCDCVQPIANLSGVGVDLGEGNLQCANPVSGVSQSESRSLNSLSDENSASRSLSFTGTASQAANTRSSSSSRDDFSTTASRSLSLLSTTITETSRTRPPTLTRYTATNSSSRSLSPLEPSIEQSCSASHSTTPNITRPPLVTSTASLLNSLTRSTASAAPHSASKTVSASNSLRSPVITNTVTLDGTRMSATPSITLDPFRDLPFASSPLSMFTSVTTSPSITPAATDSVWMSSLTNTNNTNDALSFTVPYQAISAAPVYIALHIRSPQAVRRVSLGQKGPAVVFSFSGPSGVDATFNATHIAFAFGTVRYNQFYANRFSVAIAASSFACPAKSLPSVSLTLAVQPSAATVSAESVRVATTVASSLSIATGNPSSGIAAARVAMLQNLAQCTVDVTQDDGNSFTGFHFLPIRGQYMRGAVVGNLAFFFVVSSVGLVIAAVAAVYGTIWKHKPWLEGFVLVCDVLHYPSCVLIPLAAILQPTLTSSMNLIIINPAAGDYVIGIGGLVTMLIVVCSLTYVLVCDFRCVIRSRTEASKSKREKAIVGTVPFRSLMFNSADGTSTNAEPSALLRAVKFVFESDVHWVVADDNATSSRWKQRFVFIFQDYRYRWYPLLELWVSTTLGVVAGVNLQKSAVCIAQISLIFSGYLLLLGCCVFVRPAFSRFMTVYLVCINGCGLASSTSTLLGALLNDNQALSASSVSALLVSVLSMAKTVPDLVLLALALPTLLRRVLRPFQDAHDMHELMRIQSDVMDQQCQHRVESSAILREASGAVRADEDCFSTFSLDEFDNISRRKDCEFIENQHFERDFSTLEMDGIIESLETSKYLGKDFSCVRFPDDDGYEAVDNPLRLLRPRAPWEFTSL